MKIQGNQCKRPASRPGYISYVMVLSLGIVIIGMMVSTYKTSIRSQETQAKAGLRIDYAEKEEAVLWSIVNLVPNRAMRAMQGGSNASASDRNPLRWKQIFSEALDQANARVSVDSDVASTFKLGDALATTSGDSAYTNILGIFDPIEPDPHTQDVSAGTGRIIGPGYPPPLDSDDATVRDRDKLYPIISHDKVYKTRAQSMLGLPVDEHPVYNLLPYPDLRFGYAEPGQPFVAKRNWWAFSLDLADADDHVTGIDIYERDFVVSIYEIPSQLAISAEAFTVLGKHADGTLWQNASIEGGVFATRAKVEEGMDLARVSGRRGVELSADATVGDQQFASNPFTPGVREQFELDHQDFMPVYLSSEAGRAAFIPINRGNEFFDRYSVGPEDLTLSSTTWNEYSIGALQCAMRLDITEARSELDPIPSELRFEYFKNGTRSSLDIDLEDGPEAGLPPGYIFCCMENESHYFDGPVDLAYGSNGSFSFLEGVSGSVTFNNATFGDPDVGTLKSGYYRPSYPFEIELLHGAKSCVRVMPERMPAFLQSIGADDTSVNHSLVVNVDYDGSENLEVPSIPCHDEDYGVVLKECADFTGFPSGFSIVTNLRLYIADNFNTVATTPPVGSGIPSPYYPPCSLFAPEKRYGGDIDPLSLKISGQMGSLAGDDGSGDSVHLLDFVMASESSADTGKLEVNLSPISHPAALPPVTMMNWLVVVEERRREFYEGSQAPAP